MHETKNDLGKFQCKKCKANQTVLYTTRFTPTKGIDHPKLASFIFGGNDFIIHFFEQGSPIDEYLSPGSKTNSEIIFTLSADTEAEIKEWTEKVKNAGGNVFQEAGRDGTNHYSFGFADPDGHKFNILLMEEGI